MARSLIAIAGVCVLLQWTTAATAEPIAFAVKNTSRATFKTEAPLETVVGTTSGEGGGISGTIALDPLSPSTIKGAVRVDLNTLRTGLDRRDAAMRDTFLGTGNEANRYAIFDIKGAELAGSLVPGKVTPARVRGTLTIRGKAIETVADCVINYVRLTPEQAAEQKIYGFTSDTLRVTARFRTTFTNHAMQIPQFLILRVSNDIQLEADLVLVKTP